MIVTSGVEQMVGRYLAHSLWQGAVLLLAYLGLRRWLTAGRPLTRTRTTATAIVLLVLLPLLTAVTALLPDLDTLPTAAADPVSAGLIPLPSPVLSLLQRHLTFDISELIVLVWLCGAALSLLRILAGVWRLTRVLGRNGRPMPFPGLELLAARAGLTTIPDVREWPGATAPFVAGWLRPVIVLPAGLRELLSEGEFEAVLLHELAHVKRNDVRNNLMLRFLGSLAWYQLPLKKLMGDLAHDRELCCDELAIRAMGRGIPLASALIRLEERRATQPRLVMAGTGGDFTSRVRRILDGGSAGRVFPRAAAVVLAVLLMVTASTVLVAASAEEQLAAWADRIHANIQARDPAGPFTVEMIGRTLISATIDGKVIPADRIVQRGELVQMLDHNGRPELTLEVRAPGAIQWSPRPPRSP